MMMLGFEPHTCLWGYR